MILIDVDGREHELGGQDGCADAADLAAATGWALKPSGLCRGEVCVPLLGREVTIAGDESRIDLAEWAAALGLLIVRAEGAEGADVVAVTPSAAMWC